ncbi:MAG: hypothetical protein AAF216_07440 [Pseudomonadota bacterium]
MTKSLLSSLKRSFKPQGEVEALPKPDLSRVLKTPKGTHAPVNDIVEPSELQPTETVEAKSWLTQDVSALRTALDAFSAEPENSAHRRGLFLCAHNLRGAAEPLGNPDVARLATSLCRLIEACASDTADLSLASLHVQAIGAAAEGEEGSELAQSVCVALEDSVRNRG